MSRIDSHQHFWKFDPVRDSWITDDMSVIQRDFLPVDLQAVLQENGFDGCVAVQASQSEEENTFLLSLAQQYDFIKAVVGWVDLQADNIDERLQHFSSHKKLKGFRHVLQGEAQRDLMLSPAFMNGISHLQRFNFTYDILIFNDQLKYIPEFLQAFPNQRFVIDHLAKPLIKAQDVEQWANEMRAVANYPNVYCKLSGMVTEADWKNWKPANFKPYLDVAVEAFGTGRLMFGSDWPVCLVAGSYSEVVGIVEDYFASFSAAEKDKVFGINARVFYNID